MSGSGKSLLGLWLYRMGEEEWKMKDSYHTDREVRFIIFFSLDWFKLLNYPIAIL